MKKKSGLFVKINFDNRGEAHRSEYEIKRSRTDKDELRKYLLCAGVFNKNGGTIIFQANNMEEAEDIAANNPFAKSNRYRYEILNGDIISLSV